MKAKFMNDMTRTFGRVWLKTKKHSPEILLVGGLIAGGAALVAACRATTKVDEVLAETKEKVERIHADVEAGEIRIVENDETRVVPYTEADSRKDLTRAYIKTGLDFARLYAPTVVFGGLSLTCILASHGIIHKRNTALVAAYTAVDGSFKDYRKRVVERFGNELDRELRYNIKTKEVEETVVQEDGTEAVVKKSIEVTESSSTEEYSEFARCYTDGCIGWSKDPEANLTFLRLQEKWANERLQAVGHLFLNEVYDMLGIPRSSAGAIVGWIYDPKNPDHKGDNRVDFGIYNIHIPANRDFVNGWERSIWIDPNVDGVIYDLIS